MLNSLKVPLEWLTARAEDAPTSYDPAPAGDALRVRMAWQKLRAETAPGDQLWGWVNPPTSWKKQGRLAGYAILRDGEVYRAIRVNM